MDNIYVDGELPEKCGKCNFIGHYEDGIYKRNPHCCCELYWDLHHDEIKVDKNSRDERCPFKLLSDRLAEERKKVVYEIWKEFEQRLKNKTEDMSVMKVCMMINDVLDQIEREKNKDG